MEILKFGAVDIGSNAVRLLFTSVFESKDKTRFKKTAFLRMPVRLGDDVFQIGKISEEKVKDLLNISEAFMHLVNVQRVLSFRACATAAMREASNGMHIVGLIKEKTGIDIEIISGKEEAEIICSFQTLETLKKNHSFLFVDLGGGSTEITLFTDQKAIVSESFNVGTIRLLRNQDVKDELKRIKAFLNKIAIDNKHLQIIGSGGNINKIFKLSKKNEDQPLIYDEIKDIYNYIKSFSVESRIQELGFNPDRADVIEPAAELFLKIMDWSGVDVAHAPRIGLIDGIIRQQYGKLKGKIG